MARQKSDIKRKRYTVRLLDTELEHIQQNANAAGITVSEFLRRSALNRRIHSRIKAQILGQISRLGGLQKHLLMQIKGHPYEDELRGKLNILLAEIHTVLRAISNTEGD
jgi:hypothetical protein